MTVLAAFLTCLAGLLLGLLFFAGLWLSVQRFALVKHPALLLAVSFFMRSIIVLVGFYLIIKLTWWYAFTALSGFILARALLMWRLGPVQPQLSTVVSQHGGEQ